MIQVVFWNFDILKILKIKLEKKSIKYIIKWII